MPIQRSETDCLHASLTDNIAILKKALGNSTDLVISEVPVGSTGQVRVGIVYTDGLADENKISRLMEALILHAAKEDQFLRPDVLQLLKNYVQTVGSVKEVDDFPSVFTSILSGETAILVDGFATGFIASTKGWEDRGVQESTVQNVVRGPKEAFSENIRTNTALIRRKINDPNLWLESKQIGRVTKTNVAVMYIKGIAKDKVVKEVHKRLDRIDIDGILESGNIEELIQDETFTFFPTIFDTERPDIVAGNLLEGRVAILVDGTPFVLIVPVMFTQFYQSPEDYYHRSNLGILRWLRTISFFITLLGPSVFIAVTTFHQEMLPTTLMISIAAQREGVPFPAAVEAFLLEVTFEILREAGVRIPRAVGPAISIVGALVLGEAAVQAGLVSPAMVIVVAITAITSFVIPSFSMSIPLRILRFVLMALAASFGLYGIFVGLLAMIMHLCSLRSFGVPYMAPLAPMNLADQKDTFIRLPIWTLHKRPRNIAGKNAVRERSSSPKPEDSN